MSWPKWEERVAWGRKNYVRSHDLAWRMEKFMTMTANLTALSEMIEEEGMEALLTPAQIAWWKELYEEYRNSA